MSWNFVKLGDFLKVRENRFKPNDKAISELKRIDKIDFSGKIFISDKPSNTDMILIKKGDLVISGINVEKGAMAVYTGDEDITATIHYSSYSFDENEIDIDFLKYFLKSIEFRNALKEQVPGGIKTEIKPKHLLPLLVNIPTDVKDQKAVVKILQNRNSKVDAISTELTYQHALVKKLRQQLLQDAVQGKLVPQNPSDEPASELLKKIKKQKENLIKQKKLKIGRATEQSVSLILDVEIPNTWQWCKSDEIFFVTKLAGFEYSEHISLKEIGEIPVVRAQNVRPLSIDKTNLLYIDAKTSATLERCALIKKCLLVTFIGAGIGDVATFEENERWHLAPNVAKMEPFEGCEELINVKYLNYYLMSKLGQIEIFKHVKATAQPSLSMGTIRDIDFAIPPLAEQNRIVQKLDELTQYCNELEESIKLSAEQNEKLLQQVLREALRKETIKSV